MIDDSKITEAVDAYIGYPKEIDEGIETSMRRDAFKAGAEWFTEVIWHTPQESPEDDELIITEFWDAGECYKFDNSVYIEDWESYCNNNQIAKWCYLKDILPSPNSSTRLNEAQKGSDSYDGDIIKKLPKIQGIE